jgi:hypothetical protein
MIVAVRPQAIVMMFRLLPAAKSTDGVSDLLTVAQILMPQTTTTNPVFGWIAPRFVALLVSGGFGAFYVAGMKSVLQGDIPWLDSEIPSANGVMTARALAKMYGAICAPGSCGPARRRPGCARWRRPVRAISCKR